MTLLEHPRSSCHQIIQSSEKMKAAETYLPIARFHAVVRGLFSYLSLYRPGTYQYLYRYTTTPKSGGYTIAFTEPRINFISLSELEL
jgi:hypothetical protein